MKICKIEYRDILPDRYAITDQGCIFDLESKKPVPYTIDKDGYMRCALRITPDPNTGKATRVFLVHRLVAIHFVENPDPEVKVTVNHEDGNKKFNWAKNLSWMSSRENTQHADKNGLRHVQGGGNGKAIFDEDFVRGVCEYYEKGLYPIDVFHKYYPNEPVRTAEHERLYRLLYNVKKKRIWTSVSKDYSFNTDTRHPDPTVSKVWRPREDSITYTEDDVRWICEQLEDGLTPDETAKLIYENPDLRPRLVTYKSKRLHDIIGCIWRGTLWKRISREYDFVKNHRFTQEEYDALFDELMMSGVPMEHISSTIATKYCHQRASVRRYFRKYLVKKGLISEET